VILGKHTWASSGLVFVSYAGAKRLLKMFYRLFTVGEGHRLYESRCWGNCLHLTGEN
jgi:hypothetical protein